jgi:cysteinyl-tRNA synthetase, unknown class
MIQRVFLLFMLFIFSCDRDEVPGTAHDSVFRQEMRAFVIGISQYSKAEKPGFIVIPQNGIELVSENGNSSGQPHTAYLNAIDANGQEDLFYGYNKDNQASPAEINTYLRDLLNISKNAGRKILVTDYCSTHSKMDNSYLENYNSGYVSFAADRRELDHIPDYPVKIYNENNAVIASITQVKNFLYLIDPENFSSKSSFIKVVASTNYDLLIMDLIFKEGSVFTSSEINQLKNKSNGGKRLVIAYMSIGEAENYRYYWQKTWRPGKPVWLKTENPAWEGNFRIQFWNKEWQDIIYGNDSSYLQKILDAGFDGVYLDCIDAFEYFE